MSEETRIAMAQHYLILAAKHAEDAFNLLGGTTRTEKNTARREAYGALVESFLTAVDEALKADGRRGVR